MAVQYFRKKTGAGNQVGCKNNYTGYFGKVYQDMGDAVTQLYCPLNYFYIANGFLIYLYYRSPGNKSLKYSSFFTLRLPVWSVNCYFFHIRLAKITH
jgi:hypothetical protein